MVLGRMVLNIVWGEADEIFGGLVGVLSISEVGVMEDVDSPGSGVTKEVCGPEGVGKVIVVCRDVPKGGTVVFVVLETASVGIGYVVCGAWGLLVVVEMVWPPGVALTPLVGLLDMVVGWSAVDGWCGVWEAEVASVENTFWVWVVEVPGANVCVISASWGVVV